MADIEEMRKGFDKLSLCPSLWYGACGSLAWICQGEAEAKRRVPKREKHDSGRFFQYSM